MINMVIRSLNKWGKMIQKANFDFLYVQRNRGVNLHGPLNTLSFLV